MIIDMHVDNRSGGVVRIQSWIDEDGRVWLYNHSWKKQHVYLMGVNDTPAEVAEQIADVYSQELGYLTNIIRNGTTLQMMAALYRIKSEDT